MKLKQRNGVLGLETAKEVMVSFLVLSVTAIAILLALTSLSDAVGDSIDNIAYSKSAVNESPAWINTTGYTLDNYNSSSAGFTSGFTLTTIWANTPNQVPAYNFSIPVANATISSVGVVTNTTAYNSSVFANVSLSYDYTYTVDRHRIDNIFGNVSSGLETFFASTGTIFSILIVVVIILAISIIIWAVGRFGQQTEGTVNL